MLTSSFTTLFVASAYGRTADPDIPWVRIIVAFLFCIGVAVSAILWLRARQGLPINLRAIADRLITPRPEMAKPKLEVEERLRVSPASQIILLRCEQRRYLVHIGPQGAQKIDRLDDGDAVTLEHGAW